MTGEDAGLVRAVASGSEDALVQLYDRYAGAVGARQRDGCNPRIGDQLIGGFVRNEQGREQAFRRSGFAKDALDF